ncbi:MAG TPA: ferredoxin [Candidatus Limnocylindrales bacterium]
MGDTAPEPLPVGVDRDLCIGTGDCARLAPLAFRVSDRDFISEVLPGAAATDPTLLREAAAACPVEAIVLVTAGWPDALGATTAGS